MKASKMISTLLLGLSAAAASAEAASPTNAWAGAVNSGNTALIAKLYTDDAVLISPGTELISAPEAISDYWAAKRTAGASGFLIRSVGEKLQGNTLIQSSVWTARVTSAGKETVLEGQMTNVLARQPDGSWKIQLQSWN
jgi:ketosteroid isomerase-like protein